MKDHRFSEEVKSGGINRALSVEFGWPDHHCDAYRDGDWIVFHCHTCAYERRINQVTGENIVSNPHPVIRNGGRFQEAVQ